MFVLHFTEERAMGIPGGSVALYLRTKIKRIIRCVQPEPKEEILQPGTRWAAQAQEQRSGAVTVTRAQPRSELAGPETARGVSGGTARTAGAGQGRLLPARPRPTDL